MAGCCKQLRQHQTRHTGSPYHSEFIQALLTFTQSIIASGAATAISINGASTAGGHYIGLDNVSLHQQLSGTELLTNGSFEITSGFVPDGNGAMSLLQGSTTMPGWSVVNAEIAWLTNGNPFGVKTPNGGMFLDLTGYHDGPPYGGVSQSVATTAGQPYVLSLSLGSFEENGSFAGPVSVSVATGAATNSFTLTPAPKPTNNVWMSLSFDFTANSSSTPVMVIGTSTTGGQYIGLDNISVIPVSGLRIVRTEKTGNNLRITFTSEAGSQYAVQTRPDVASGDWTQLPGTTAGTGAAVQATITNAFTTAHQFYRIERLP